MIEKSMIILIFVNHNKKQVCKRELNLHQRINILLIQ